MATRKAKAAPAEKLGTAHGTVVSLQARDNRENARSLRNIQASRIARQFGVTAPTAAAIAALAFGEVRA